MKNKIMLCKKCGCKRLHRRFVSGNWEMLRCIACEHILEKVQVKEYKGKYTKCRVRELIVVKSA